VSKEEARSGVGRPEGEGRTGEAGPRAEGRGQRAERGGERARGKGFRDFDLSKMYLIPGKIFYNINSGAATSSVNSDVLVIPKI
jgi:hypothetical protein